MKRESIQRRLLAAASQSALQRPFNLASAEHLPTSSSHSHPLHPSQIKLLEQPLSGKVPVLVQVAPGSGGLQAHRSSLLSTYLSVPAF